MLAIGLSIAPMSAYAVVIIDFGDGILPEGGILTSLGGNNSMGVDIPIGFLEVTGAPLNNGTYTVTNGLLDYDTVQDTISISGAITGLGFNTPITLLTGSFSSFTTSFSAGNYLYFDGSGPDTKNPDLLLALGLNPTTPFTFMSFTLSGQPIAGTGSFEAISTDVKNTQVPEPATLLLLGCGLIGLAGFARKKFKK